MTKRRMIEVSIEAALTFQSLVRSLGVNGNQRGTAQGFAKIAARFGVILVLHRH
jgi:hypothetical protein